MPPSPLRIRWSSSSIIQSLRFSISASSSTTTTSPFRRPNAFATGFFHSHSHSSPTSKLQASYASPTAAAAVIAFSAAATMYTATVSKGPEAQLAVPDDAAAKAHHMSNGRFRNPHPSAGPELSWFGMGWKVLSASLRGENSFPDPTNHHVPSVTPTFLPTRTHNTTDSSSDESATSSSLRATWLGHACYYVEFPSGLRVLFDPVFEPCCSPPPASWLGFPKRYTPPAALPVDLPFVDAVVISHSHYDHLSLPSVKAIVAKHPRAHFFVGLGLEKWFRSLGVQEVTELDWWQDATFTLVKNDKEKGDGPSEIAATISCLPCQHTSARTAFDKDTTLWCSWAVSSGGKSTWFAGDTGYRHIPRLEKLSKEDEDLYDGPGDVFASLPRNPDFKKIGDLRGPFDLGLIPIGAYKPRYLFSMMHACPGDAVEIFKDTRCKKAMAIHWGTWVLTAEDVDEPPRLLRAALKEAGLEETGRFDTCALGESREF